MGAAGSGTTQVITNMINACNIKADYMALAPYQGLSGDNSTINSAFSPAGYPGVTDGNWPVDAINDFVRHSIFYNPVTRTTWTNHTNALPSGVKLVCYESGIDYPIPFSVPNYTWLSEDMLYHESYYDLVYGYELFLQQGNPQQSGTGSVLSSYFTSAGLGFGQALWRLESGLAQPIGHGVSNQFLTPQGGPGSTGAHGFGYAQTNQAPGVQLLKDWNQATTVSAVGYTLSGPTAGFVGDTYTYTVTPAASVADTVTLSDSSGGGQFSPTSLTFSGSSTAQTFTYTPGSKGTKSISATSAMGGAVGGSPVSLVVTSTGYIVAGPTSGFKSNPITYTVTPAGTTTDTITFSDSSGGGTFAHDIALVRRHELAGNIYVRARLDRHEDADAHEHKRRHNRGRADRASPSPR